MSSWPTGHIHTLKTLWEAGMSGRAIGVRLCRTKNAIIGKAHRLELVHGGMKRGEPIVPRSVPAVQAEPTEPIHIPTLPPPHADSCSVNGCRLTSQPGSWQRRCATHSTKAYLAAHRDEPRLVEVGRAGAV